MKPAEAVPLALLLALACAPAGDAPTLDLPERPPDAPTGEQIAEELRDLDFEAREERIVAEVARGNVPDFLRNLERVEITDDVGGRARTVTFWVTPDYLSVGHDTAFFLVPLSPRTARRIAEIVGGSLPTSRMVDAVWEAADVRLPPIRIRPDEHLRTMRYIWRHDRMVTAQRWLHGVRPGAFVAGHKLDLVRSRGEGVSMYGWHQVGGQPIQPAIAVDEGLRPQFSLGVRLVHRRVLVDGVRRDLEDVLGDTALARLLGAYGSP